MVQLDKDMQDEDEDEEKRKEWRMFRNELIKWGLIMLFWILFLRMAHKVPYIAVKEPENNIKFYEYNGQDIQITNGEYALFYDKYTKIVYYPNLQPYISKNGYYVRYVNDTLHEVKE